MSKTLSNGTLSLRFMQNARRAKQQAQVEAEQAKIKDEAEWEVSQVVKEAWGIGSSSQIRTSAITHEASYLPFLFSPTADDQGDSSTQAASVSVPKLKGRRTFNARGQEVISEAKAEVKEEGQERDQDPKDASKPTKRPRTISGFQAPISITKTKDSKRTKTAQMLIREDTGKGLRAPPPLQMFGGSSRPQSTSSETGFLKPSGVDSPSASRQNGFSNPSSSMQKRSRETEDPTVKEEKRRNKKKKEASS
ncbi:unnamed protein product [Somion occarium]|uniref:Uncharacterized protein n=1 Tax=Somion occarium TaxID=3059160 RepID=A0ABP1CUJ7_9APHY